MPMMAMSLLPLLFISTRFDLLIVRDVVGRCKLVGCFACQSKRSSPLEIGLFMGGGLQPARGLSPALRRAELASREPESSFAGSTPLNLDAPGSQAISTLFTIAKNGFCKRLKTPHFSRNMVTPRDGFDGARSCIRFWPPAG